LNECLVELSKAGATAWRNNTGVLKDAGGRPVKFGLCKGGADIIGIAPDGLFLAVECKTDTGRANPDQERFLSIVRARGGRAGIARSGAEAVEIATAPVQARF
jgi:hypothetical protein